MSDDAPDFVTVPDPLRPCGRCQHFARDFAHPLHSDLCTRVEGRLLSAAFERTLPAPSCGPEGRDFLAKSDEVPA